MNSFDSLILKLDAFIRKYYKNQLLKGGLYFSFLILGFFLCFSLLEYFAEFGALGRSILFFSFISIGISLLGYYNVIPLLKIYKLGKLISYQEAAGIIGLYFPEIKDKILNTLQLEGQKQNGPDNTLDLVNASIEKRTARFKSISFNKAINLKENTRYLKPFGLIFGVFLLLSFIDQSILFSPAERILHYSTENPANQPYEITFLNESLAILEQEDFNLRVRLVGNKIPNSISINYANKKYSLTKKGPFDFEYLFKNVSKKVPFTISSSTTESKNYNLDVIPKPKINHFSILLTYPAYTRQKVDTFKNIGSVTIPEGTQVKWLFDLKNVDSFSAIFNDTAFVLNSTSQPSFIKTFYRSQDYQMVLSNKSSDYKDTSSFYTEVLKDQLPKIKMEETIDSTNKYLRYFNVEATDDYGFSNLYFCYKKQSANKIIREKIPISLSSTFLNQYHFFNLKTLGANPGETVEYFFELWDNDAINGPKSVKTDKKVFNPPTIKEIANDVSEKNNAFKSLLDENIEEATRLKEELKNIKKELYNKKQLNWEDKNKIEDFLKQQNSLKENLEEMLKNNSSDSDSSEEIIKKQEQLNKLFEELMTDEMKKLYDELQKLMEELNKDKVLEKMEDIELSQEDLIKELDRSLEQFKQLEMDQKLESLKNELEKLSKKQQDLAKKTKEKKENHFSLNKEQEQIKEDFNFLKEEMDGVEELNKELENKKNLPSFDEEEKSINEDINESQESLEKKNNKKASESQQKAGDKMKELSGKLGDLQMKMKAESQEMDMKSLRQLLENLITFSFDQEVVLGDLKNISSKDPKYVKAGQEQQKLEQDIRLIEDSLLALSKRIPQLGPHINAEVSLIKKHLTKTIKNITERKTAQANANQQYTMTSVNNLALLLDDVLKQLQQSIPGSGQCNKPGGNGKSAGQDMKKMMEKMKQQLSEMKKMMGEKKGEGEKPGSKPGEKPGGKQSGGKGSPSAESLAKLAAEQAALKQKIRELSDLQNGDGSGSGNGLKKIIKTLEKIEDDIINNNINPETLNRQQSIITKMLEHEKANREQEKEKKRQSKEIKEQEFSNPNQFLEYKRKKEKELELLKTIPPSLIPYYKNKVNEYFNTLQD